MNCPLLFHTFDIFSFSFTAINQLKILNYYSIKFFDLYSIFSIVGYQGESQLPDYWWPANVPPTPSAYDLGVEGICRDIIGTDGLAYHQFVEKDEVLWLFNADLCRFDILFYSNIDYCL